MNLPAAESLGALRARLSRVEHRVADPAPLGAAAVDARLGGGIARASLHELFADAEEDAAAATGFALMLALQIAAMERTLLWLRDDAAVRRGGRIEAMGLVDLGIDPARVLLTRAADAKGLLKAALDALRCDRLGAVIVETWGRAREIDLIATRRLTLAARASGVTLIAARIAAEPVPSAAWTRWRIAAARSTPLEDDAPGPPAFDVKLLRDRGGCPPFAARLEWDRERLAFTEAPLSGGVAAVPSGRAALRVV